jgi:glycosyltransferase involved in cell wall biosynthesis
VSQAFIDELRRRGHRVFVVAHRRPGESEPAHPDDLIAGQRPIETGAAGVRAAAWLVRALLRRLPYSAAKYVSRGYRRRLRQALAQGPELLVLDHAQTAWTLRTLRRGPAVAYLAHNVEHELYGEQAVERTGPARLLYAREARMIRRLEERALSHASQAWALSNADAATLAAMGAHGRARAFAVAPAWEPVAAAAEMDVALLGRWTWAANAIGLSWFVRDVVPHLPPGTGVHIAGDGAEAHAGTPGVTVHGPVPDARRFLAGARAIAIPARAGAGVQVKTLDAIATGRPVVATTRALRGIAGAPPTVRIADDPRAFARGLEQAVAAPPGGDGHGAEAARAWVLARRQRFSADLGAAIAALAGDVG